MLQWFIRFPELAEFAEFNESSYPFGEIPLFVPYFNFLQINQLVTLVFTHSIYLYATDISVFPFIIKY